jgi:hypothetical protein
MLTFSQDLRRVLGVWVLATFALNLIWEVAHLPLYSFADGAGWLLIVYDVLDPQAPMDRGCPNRCTRRQLHGLQRMAQCLCAPVMGVLIHDAANFRSRYLTIDAMVDPAFWHYSTSQKVFCPEHFHWQRGLMRMCCATCERPVGDCQHSVLSLQ